jgi:predicted RNA-binding Zn-ribbon protein involved in translation (DUF1610 family)
VDELILNGWAEVMCRECFRWIPVRKLLAEADGGYALFNCPFCGTLVIRDRAIL